MASRNSNKKHALLYRYRVFVYSDLYCGYYYCSSSLLLYMTKAMLLLRALAAKKAKAKARQKRG